MQTRPLQPLRVQGWVVATGRIVITHTPNSGERVIVKEGGEHNTPPGISAASIGDTIERPEFDSMQKSRI